MGDWERVYDEPWPFIDGYFPSMAFHAGIGKAVLQHYDDDRTWLWDGTSWSVVVTATNPGFRGASDMVYDPVRGVVIRFGGDDGAGNNMTNDTWEFDGTDWELISTANSPPERVNHRMVYDSVRGEVVLYGGENYDGTPSSFYSDTWVYNGTNWTQKSPASNPGPRGYHLFAFDANAGKALLFGGYVSDSYDADNETWEWNGTNWTQLSPANSPEARHDIRGAYDSTRQRIVLHGGQDAFNGFFYNDTWEWTGSNWSEQQTDGTSTTLVRPSTQYRGYALAFDSVRAKTYLFGSGSGISLGAPGHTWAWDGSGTWDDVQPVHPFGAWDIVGAVDTDRNVLVLVSQPPAGNTRMDHDRKPLTWEWDGSSWVWKDVIPTGFTWDTGDDDWSDQAIAYDEARGEMVIFGGLEDHPAQSPVVIDKTFTWNGTSYTLKSPANKPSARFNACMWYDPVSQLIVLFGGDSTTGSGGALSDTWTWNGTNWTQYVDGGTHPPVPTGSTSIAALPHAYDLNRSKVVLVAFNDTTWEWTYAGGWTQISTATTPTGGNQDARMTYDPATQRIIMFGGTGSTNSKRTWEYDGSNWTLISTTLPFTLSLGRTAPVMFTLNGRAYLFSGRGPSTDPYFAVDMWRYGAAAAGAFWGLGTNGPAWHLL